jgi:TonB family protein
LILALVAHVGLIFLFGTRKPIVPMPLGSVPHLHLTDSANELVALSNPTWLARPNVHDLTTTCWQQLPPVPPPNFDWPELPRFLELNPAHLGAAFHEFVQQNLLADFPLNFKSEPDAAVPTVDLESPIPNGSTLEFLDELAQRQPLNIATPPSWTRNDVLAPSKVEVLVEKDGYVVSAVVLQSSKDIDADDKALEMARNLRFTPAAQPTMGDIIFHWHTVPANPPAAATP